MTISCSSYSFDGSSACQLVPGLTTPCGLSNSEAHYSSHWLLSVSQGISYTWPCDSFTFPTWTYWPSCSIQCWFSVPLKPTTRFRSAFRSQGWVLHSLNLQLSSMRHSPRNLWKPVLGLWAWGGSALGAVQGFPSPLWLRSIHLSKWGGQGFRLLNQLSHFRTGDFTMLQCCSLVQNASGSQGYREG